MSNRISIDAVKSDCEASGWKLLSDSYKNLKTELKFECPEQHIVYLTYEKFRHSHTCPVCARNNLVKNDEIVIPKKEKGKTRILSIDQATQITGWAIFDDKDLIKFGKLCIDSGLDKSERIHQVKTWLISMIDNIKPDYIYFEDIQLQDGVNKGHITNGESISVITYRALCELIGVLCDTAIDCKVQFKIIHSSTWRAYCGIRGKTRVDKKRSAQLIIKERYGVSVSEDEADAICIGICGAEKYIRPVEMIKW